MKRKFSMTRAGLLTLGIFIVGALFTSCLKNDNGNGVRYEVSGIALINAAPGSPFLDLISDGQRKYLPAPFAYDSSMAYLSAYPGYRVFGFTLHNSYDLITSQQFYLKPGNAYSIFIADSLPKAQLICISDTMMLPDTTQSAIRFANFSPNSTALELYLENNKQVENVLYTNASAFQTIKPSNNYTFNVREKGTNKILAYLNGASIEKGKAYTIWASGYENSKYDSTNIHLSIMRNR